MCREISDRDSNSLKNHALKARIPRKAYENPKKSQSSPKNPISSINMRFNSCFETHPNKHEQNKRKKILSIHIQFSVIPNQTNEFFSFLLHILLLSFIYCSVLLANPLWILYKQVESHKNMLRNKKHSWKLRGVLIYMIVLV
jgi:hypothetical protein